MPDEWVVYVLFGAGYILVCTVLILSICADLKAREVDRFWITEKGRDALEIEHEEVENE